MSLYGLHHRYLNSAAAGLVRLEYSIYASTRSVCATPRAVKDSLPELFCLHIHGSTEMIIIFMVDKEALSGKDVYWIKMHKPSQRTSSFAFAAVTINSGGRTTTSSSQRASNLN